MALQVTATLKPVLEMWREASRFIAILRRFRHYLRPQLRPMIWATLASIAFTLVVLLEPWPLQVIFDGVLLDRPVQFLGLDLQALAGNPLWLLAGASLAVLVLALLRGQFYYAQNVLAATAGIDVVMAIRRELFHHLQSLSPSFHRQARAGDLLMRLTGDIVMLREMVVAALITFFSRGLVLIGTLVLMLTLNAKLTLVAAVITPTLLLVLSAFRIRLVDAAGRQRKREGRLATSAHEVLTSVELVQAYTAERFEDARFKEMNRRSRRAGVRLTRIEARLNRAVQITMAAGLCCVLWLGTRDVLAGHLSPGELLVFLAYLRGVYRPLRDISKLTQRMAKASACSDRVLEVLDTVAEIEDVADPEVLRDVRGEIVFDQVSFAYDGRTPAVAEIDLRIQPGEMVAFVGPTGSGKSTLLALLLRFFDVHAGEIRIDGRPIPGLSLRSLRRNISLLPQETVIRGATVYENIAYGAVGRSPKMPTRRQVARAARAARAHEFIERLPRGYDTVVGERGGTLSGGQRQRIAIARAVLRKARILLLDEPTTGLDPVSGQAVLEALNTLAEGRTTLVVAHQLSTVLRADRIVFLEQGRIREQGTHAELMRSDQGYAEFFRTEWGGLAAQAEKDRDALAATS